MCVLTCCLSVCLSPELPNTQRDVIIVSTASTLATLLLLATYVITIIVAIAWFCRWWKRSRTEQEQEEEGGDYNMVLTHNVNTTTHQSTGTVPNPAYSKVQILSSGNDPSDDANTSQLQVKAEQNNSLHSSYTALNLDTLQVQPYTKLNIPDKEGGMIKVEGVSDAGKADRRVGAVDRAAGKNEASAESGEVGVKAHKEMEVLTLDVHPYIPLDASTMAPAEKEETEGK